MARYGFHPGAIQEFADATSYYLREATPEIAGRFVNVIEAGVAAIVAAPERWRVVAEPEIRRFVVRRFPFVIYYRWQCQQDLVTVFAIMHCSREPGYWKERVLS